MARPKYHEGDDTARDKLEAAFWDALGETAYEDISVVGLCKAAGVNKNTFYYHFHDIDELARSAAESIIETRYIYTAIEAVRGNARVLGDLPEEEIAARLDRVCLLADDKAPAQLRRMLHDAVLGLWETELGVNVASLDLRDRISLEFVLAGFLGVFAFRNRTGSNFVFKDVWGAEYLPHAYGILEKYMKES